MANYAKPLTTIFDLPVPGVDEGDLVIVKQLIDVHFALRLLAGGEAGGPCAPGCRIWINPAACWPVPSICWNCQEPFDSELRPVPAC